MEEEDVMSVEEIKQIIKVKKKIYYYYRERMMRSSIRRKALSLCSYAAANNLHQLERGQPALLGSASRGYVTEPYFWLHMKGGPKVYAKRIFCATLNAKLLTNEERVFYNVRACMSLIRTEQAMSYRACKTCNKKVNEALDSGYWCEACKKNDASCSLRYIFSAKFSDASGGAWFSVFSEEAEKIIGCSADELDKMKSQDDLTEFQTQLKKATWVPHIFRVMVAPREYNNEKKQRITVKSIAPVDFTAESKFLLDEISSMKV